MTGIYAAEWVEDDGLFEVLELSLVAPNLRVKPSITLGQTSCALWASHCILKKCCSGYKQPWRNGARPGIEAAQPRPHSMGVRVVTSPFQRCYGTFGTVARADSHWIVWRGRSVCLCGGSFAD